MASDTSICEINPDQPGFIPDETPLDIKKKNPALYFKIRKNINRAIRDYGMFSRSDRIAVALSGGKDSVTLLLFLKDLNYKVEAFFLDLGIKKFTPKSLAFVHYICGEAGIPFKVVSAADFAGFTVDDTVKNYPGKQCSICGTLKRQMFNRYAIDNGFDVLAVGHNMDDETEMLFSNNLKWDFEYLAKSIPVLAAKAGFVKRVKPLCYLRDSEIKKFVKSSGIDVLHCQCPHSAKGSRRKYSRIFDFASTLFPGFVESYYMNFLKNAVKILSPIPPGAAEIKACAECGEPSTASLCRLCAIKQGLWRKKGDPNE